jgi:hypothetical protein
VTTKQSAPAPGASRREAELAALEAAIVAAVTGHLARRIGRAIGTLRTGWRLAVGRGPEWTAIRRSVAADLLSIRPGLAAPTARMLPRAARLGATHLGGTLPAGHEPAADDLIAEAIDTIDASVRARLTIAAARLTAEPVDTPARLDAATGRIDTARTHAETTVGDAVARAAAGGATAVADETGIDLTWWTEPSACLSCQSMAGSVRSPGGLFLPVTILAPRIIPWLPAGVACPPAHRSCRCHLEPATEGLAEALAREAERSVARGESAFDSLPARLRAVDALLSSGTRLPRSVRARAAQDRALGRFSRRDVRRAG